MYGNFPGSPVAKTNAGGTGVIPGQASHVAQW